MIDFIAQNAGLLGLLFFFTFFIALILWIMRPGAKELYKQISELPLKENSND